ncbi:MAG: cytidylate kinase-like family protein [Clostridia bacterium]|nr:cytidylate kinase-like family protein [Clostridia bacterium]
MNKIITIGREFGSGGREFGRRLAEELQIEYYDKEIVTEIAKHTSLSEEYVQQVVECKPHPLYPITIGQSMVFMENYANQQIQSVYQAQCEILHELAEKSDCVIVGRCADYILRDYHPCRIFVYADLSSRIRRCMERSAENEKLTEKEMKQKILAVDKNRAKYYEYYTGGKWGDKANYDLCINTSGLNIKKAVPVIAKMFR